MLTIGEKNITGTTTNRIAVALEDGTWALSWLPRPVTRNGAITGMMLAETASGIGLSDDPRWLHVDSWAGELGLSGPAAVAAATAVAL
jgi:hypothetical protein